MGVCSREFRRTYFGLPRTDNNARNFSGHVSKKKMNSYGEKWASREDFVCLTFWKCVGSSFLKMNSSDTKKWNNREMLIA